MRKAIGILSVLMAIVCVGDSITAIVLTLAFSFIAFICGVGIK